MNWDQTEWIDGRTGEPNKLANSLQIKRFNIFFPHQNDVVLLSIRGFFFPPQSSLSNSYYRRRCCRWPPFLFQLSPFPPSFPNFFFIIFYFYFLIRPSPLLFIFFYPLLSFPLASFSPYLSRFFLYLFIFISLLVNLHYYLFYFIFVIF